MKVAVAIGFVVTSFGFVQNIRATQEYDTPTVEIISTFEAKQLCSCLFVTKGPEESCMEFSQLTKNPPKVTVDHERLTVTSDSSTQKQRARFIDDRTGCILEN